MRMIRLQAMILAVVVLGSCSSGNERPRPRLQPRPTLPLQSTTPSSYFLPRKLQTTTPWPIIREMYPGGCGAPIGPCMPSKDQLSFLESSKEESSVSPLRITTFEGFDGGKLSRRDRLPFSMVT